MKLTEKEKALRAAMALIGIRMNLHPTTFGKLTHKRNGMGIDIIEQGRTAYQSGEISDIVSCCCRLSFYIELNNDVNVVYHIF